MNNSRTLVIANHIVRILNTPKDRLKEVSLNGKRFVERYYGYTATLSRWKNKLGISRSAKNAC